NRSGRPHGHHGSFEREASFSVLHPPLDADGDRRELTPRSRCNTAAELVVLSPREVPHSPHPRDARIRASVPFRPRYSYIMEASPFIVPTTTPRARVLLLAAASMVLALGFEPGVAGAKKQQTTCNGVPATIIANKNDVTIVGTPGPDVIVGNNKANIIHGGGGDDIICGGGGDDQLFGDEDNDQLFGGGGDDMLDGGADADRLFGQDGDDTLVGGLGDDVLNGGKGDDVVIGGQGAHRALLGAGGGTLCGEPCAGSDVDVGRTPHEIL